MILGRVVVWGAPIEGAFVSDKIMQAAVPPLNIPGLAAKDWH